MNFFFNILSEELSSCLTIPRFKNDSELAKDYLPFKAKIFNGFWNITKTNFIDDGMFFHIDKEECDNDNIIFLAKENDINSKRIENLINYNSYTDTIPDYRSNLRVENYKGGFSSYQSEYPFDMVQKKGQILSPVYPLLNKDANENYIFLKNIYKQPIQTQFKVYFVDIKKNIVVEEIGCITNKTNKITISNKLIDPNIYLITDSFLGIPIFCSILNGFMSLEHTHPPHLYILSKDRFEIIKKLKGKIFDITYKKN